MSSVDKELLLDKLEYWRIKLKEYTSLSDLDAAYLSGGIVVVTELAQQIREGRYDKGVPSSFNPIGAQSGRFSCDSSNTSAKPTETRIVNGHVLYNADDFKHMTAEELELDWVAHLVLDGGIDICKACGEGEAGLDNPCKPKGGNNG